MPKRRRSKNYVDTRLGEVTEEGRAKLASWSVGM